MLEVMRSRGVAMLLTLGCGGSHHSAQDPAAQAREAERKRIEAMEPKRPYETRSVVGYRAPTPCGQGPYRIEAAALGSKFGEEFEVSICAPRSLQGDYRFARGADKDEPRHFGSRNNSEQHCVATAGETAQRTTASPGSTSSAATSAVATSSTATSSAAPITLTRVSDSVGESCPEGTYLTGILNYTSEMGGSGDGVPLAAGMPLVVDMWSAEPLYLDGAIFVVIQRGVPADMTAEKWTSYREAYKRWNATWNAYLEGEVTAGRATYADMNARTEAPPPPRVEVKPPQPSTHAEWIAGYWQRDREWIWSPGFWRVPESDLVAEQTIAAPVAPPPLKTEEPPPAPVAQATVTPAPTSPAPTSPAPRAVPVNLVWTPGYWTWNGTAYIWIEGAWRIAPHATARWVPPTWSSRRGRYILQPGGWSVRIAPK